MEKKKFSYMEYVAIGLFGPFVIIFAAIVLPFYWLGRLIAKCIGAEK